ncbi:MULTISPECIES: heme exporter protein CcmD [unclassified Sphingomonas]|nr:MULTISPECIES: heme exporter protein CcmD [unclassified Sphingomonas]
MNHWPFIVAAYAITIIGTAGVLVASFVRMRRAERRADSLGRRD